MTGALFPFLNLSGEWGSPKRVICKDSEVSTRRSDGHFMSQIGHQLSQWAECPACAIMRGMETWEEGLLAEFSAFPCVKFLGVSGTQREGPGLDLHCPFSTSEDYLLSRVFQQQRLMGRLLVWRVGGDGSAQAGATSSMS